MKWIVLLWPLAIRFACHTIVLSFPSFSAVILLTQAAKATTLVQSARLKCRPTSCGQYQFLWMYCHFYPSCCLRQTRDFLPGNVSESNQIGQIQWLQSSKHVDSFSQIFIECQAENWQGKTCEFINWRDNEDLDCVDDIMIVIMIVSTGIWR